MIEASSFVFNENLFADKYLYRMGETLFQTKMHEKEITYDLFYRINPFKGGYSVFAGTDLFYRILDNWNKFSYNSEDLKWLQNYCSKEFYEYLIDMDMKDLEIRAFPEGSIILPNVPLMTIKGPALKVILIETVLLNCINHQSLIATKASRIYHASKGKILSEFGARRAHGIDAAVYGTRAAYIAGFDNTSLISQENLFGIPTSGTMAHFLPMFFGNDEEAFLKFVETKMKNEKDQSAIFILDTYDTIFSGTKDAIKVFKYLKEKNLLPPVYGGRLDSGDLGKLSLITREAFDKAGFPDAKIFASNDLDEEIIEYLESTPKGIRVSKIDAYGVGTKLITSSDWSSFGAVYKLSSVEGEPKMKFSNNIEKSTNPGYKDVYKISSPSKGLIGMYLSLHDESPIEPVNGEYKFYDPNDPDIEEIFTEKDALYIESVLESVSISEYCKKTLKETTLRAKEVFMDQFEDLQEEAKRFKFPQILHVYLSDELWDLKRRLKNEMKEIVEKKRRG